MSPPVDRKSFPIEKVLEIIKKNIFYEGDETDDLPSSPFRVLISGILSSRTKDEVTYTASKKLFEVADTPLLLMNLSQRNIEELIFPVGFYRKKAETLRKVSKMLVERYDGDVPDDLSKLLSLPMVGRKIANLVLSRAFGKPSICVDTHVHRITNRWGLVSTRTPLETEKELMKKLPEGLWKDLNHPLVLFGKRVCTPISPLCSRCPISRYCRRVGVNRMR